MKFSYLIIIFFLFSCSNNSKPLRTSEVIVSASLITFYELTEEQKSNLRYSRCCCYPNNWNIGVNCIEKEEAFYVATEINNKLLAKFTESETFNKAYLLNDNPHFLYGKYKNRWRFIDEDGVEICEGSKEKGHNSFNLVRIDSIDSMIIGPLPKKPKEIGIKISNSKYYSNLAIKRDVKE